MMKKMRKSTRIIFQICLGIFALGYAISAGYKFKPLPDWVLDTGVVSEGPVIWSDVSTCC